MGRPSDYNDEIASEICRRLGEGESLRGICRDESMPGLSTVMQWLQKHEKFAEQYTRAREVQADVLADEIVAISDEQAVCYTKEGTPFDPDVQRDRLRVDARKWFASKVAPKKYGDKLELAGDKERPLLVEVVRFGNAG